MKRTPNFRSNSLLNGKYVFALLASLFLLLPYIASAEVVLRHQDTVRVDSDQIVSGNFYSIGTDVSVSGTVEGDWFGLGRSITGNGTFQDDVLLIGNTVNLHGSTTDDVRIVGYEVTVADYVGGDLVVVANSVKILSTAEISGDVLLFANNVEISGSVAGSVLGRAGNLRLDSAIGGSVDIIVSQLTLGDRARIAGDVKYESSQILTRAQNAEVEGSINFTEISISTSPIDGVRSALLPILAIVFASLTGFLLIPNRLQVAVRHSQSNFLLHTLIGGMVLIAFPFLALIFMVSGLGAVVGGVMLATYALLLFLSLALTAPLFGLLIGQSFFNRKNIDLLTIGSGGLVLISLFVLPLVGMIILLSLVCVSFGGLVTKGYGKLRQNR